MTHRSGTGGVSGIGRWAGILAVGGLCALLPLALAAGSTYRESAHGDGARGVDRTSIDPKFDSYATGNCAHCHEMHASLDGVEPAPQGGAAPHGLFASNFNSSRTEQIYLESDNFCFSCHSLDSGQQVTNQDYSATFGGAVSGSGPQSIMEAFNQASYHNLYDIWNFLRNNPSFQAFKDAGNPCSGCHNPHLAKSNKDGSRPGYPLLSAISRPNDPSKLWGETELMSRYLSYEAPYALGTGREPAGVGDFDGDKTPDYAGFCTTCHTPLNLIWSTTLNRHLKKINWGRTGEKPDKHGDLSRDGSQLFREPYLSVAPTKNNFVLSCLDCHEPHGSQNIMLLRRRMNGENLEDIIPSTDTMGFACKRCHQDDLAAGAGTNQAGKWEYVHHLAPGAPYAQMSCEQCHEMAGGGGGMGGEGTTPIPCGNCHGHGMSDNWAGMNMTGRTTF